MSKERISPSISYLIEMIVAILFFAAACVICVTIFYQASFRSTQNEARSQALHVAQSIAEDAIASNRRIESGTWYADGNWHRQEAKSEYRVVIKERALEDDLYVYELQMSKRKEVLLKLEFTVLDKEGS